MAENSSFPFSRVVVTGAAGFIGFHLTQRLLRAGVKVWGVDNLNPYYDPQLKHDRLAQLQGLPGFTFAQIDLADRSALEAVFEEAKPDVVVNLAAQAGVRYSLEAPQTYVDSNITGFLNVLECCRAHPVAHLLFASSSSVYGGNTKVPFAEGDPVDHPVSLYAATKKANELMAHCYAHLYAIPTTGLRFFTVYGPWGRPDMAYFKFVKTILAGQPIDVYNHGDMLRDFTYIDDIVEGVVRLMGQPATPDPDFAQHNHMPDRSHAPYRLYNIGNNNPVPLMDMIALLEAETGHVATKNMLPMQPGDVPVTYADIDQLRQAIGFAPITPLAKGIPEFVRWYRDYYRVGNGPATSGPVTG